MKRGMILLVSAVLAIAVLAVPAHPQSQSAPPQAQPPRPAPAAQEAAPPAANPADVASPDAILAALYDVISGPAGQKRDWDRFRSLFTPGARLIPTGPRPGEAGDGFGARVLTAEDYITRASTYLETNGFFEKEIARRTERFGNILHAFSTYESRHKADDPAPFSRGINSIQLFYDGKRWWVVTIFWQAETPETPIPKEYLPASARP